MENNIEKVEKIIKIAKLSCAAYLAYLAYCEKEENDETHSERRWWVRELNLSRDTKGFFATNFQQMKDKDPEQFFKITRMSAATFDVFEALVEPHLEKSSWRMPIQPKARLFLTLLYLSQGCPKQVLAWMFRMGYSTVAKIIYETCDILWDLLMPLYLAPPNEVDWKSIARDFELFWNLPNCVAAIDGKHINIRCPPGAGSEYYNYKGHHSIVLLAACDANYTFVAVDIGAYGSQSDGGIFAESSFGKKILSGEMNFPPPKLLPNSNFKCNHYMVGDAAFPLKPYLMRPYPGKLLEADKFYFNKRLSRARRVIENAFGILVARWRILETTLNMLPSNAERVVKATVVLHNFIKLNDQMYCPPELVDVCNNDGEIITQGQWRNEAAPLPKSRTIGSHNSTREAFTMRDELKKFLNANRI